MVASSKEASSREAALACFVAQQMEGFMIKLLVAALQSQAILMIEQFPLVCQLKLCFILLHDQNLVQHILLQDLTPSPFLPLF